MSDLPLPSTETKIPETTSPVFTKNCFTGQPETDDEYVECNACHRGLVHLRSSAWFDSYRPYGENLGSYVHYECLSPRRKDELRLEGYRFNGDADCLPVSSAPSV